MQQPSLPPHIEFSQSLSGKIRFNLSDSTAESLDLSRLNSWLNTSELDQKITYASIRGSLELRAAINDYHKGELHGLDDANVLTFCGAQEALKSVYQALLEPGDEIIVCRPSYPSLLSMADENRARCHTIDLTFDRQWNYGVEDYEKLVNPRTRFIFINSPHNPTGALFPSTEIPALIALASKYHCWIVLDEVSAHTTRTQSSQLAALMSYKKTVTISAFSKSLGLSGLRIGWAITHCETLYQKLLAIKCGNSICTSRLDEIFGVSVLENRAQILKQNYQTVQNNIVVFESLINRFPTLLTWVAPSDGIMAVVKVNVQIPIKQWCKQVAESTGVLLLPTELFGLEGNYVRLGLGKENFSQGVEVLSQYLTRTYP